MIDEQRLPELLDAAGLQRELGVTKHVAWKLIERLPPQTIPGVRKVYVRRADVRRLLDEHHGRGADFLSRRRAA